MIKLLLLGVDWLGRITPIAWRMVEVRGGGVVRVSVGYMGWCVGQWGWGSGCAYDSSSGELSHIAVVCYARYIKSYNGPISKVYYFKIFSFRKNFPK